jgi:hypothetical protein
MTTFTAIPTPTTTPTTVTAPMTTFTAIPTPTTTPVITPAKKTGSSGQQTTLKVVCSPPPKPDNLPIDIYSAAVKINAEKPGTVDKVINRYCNLEIKSAPGCSPEKYVEYVLQTS